MNKTIESSLFSYKSVSNLEADCLAFEECVSKVPFGNFPIGSKFSSIWLNWNTSEMILYQVNSNEDNDELVATLPISLKVG